MSERLNLKIITPEKIVFFHDADSILLPGTAGEMEVLPGHVAIFSTIKPGQIVIRDGSRKLVFACGAGLLEVNKDKVSLLVDSAEGNSEIDPKAAAELIASLEDKLKDLESEDEETRFAFETQLATAKARIEVYEQSQGDIEAQSGFSRYAMPAVEKEKSENPPASDAPK